MQQINVTINQRDYTIACEDGQEEHLEKLATYLDQRVTELAGSIGQVGHARLLVIAGLLVSDELSDAFAEIEQLKTRLAEAEGRASDAARAQSEAGEAARSEADRKAAEALENAAKRVDAIAASLQAS